MTEETIKELIKAFAYGKTVDQVAEAEDMAVDEATAFKSEHATEIEERKALLKEEGWE